MTYARLKHRFSRAYLLPAFFSLMKIPLFAWALLSVAMTLGCRSHRHPVVYSPGTTVVTPSGAGVERVYPDNPPVTPPPIVEAPPGAEVSVNPPVAIEVPADAATVSGSDLAVVGSIRQALETDTPTLSMARRVQITVDDGRVVLRGTVGSEHERQELKKRIAQLPGVKSVENLVQVDLR